jgi:hypothetical protein
MLGVPAVRTGPGPTMPVMKMFNDFQLAKVAN